MPQTAQLKCRLVRSGMAATHSSTIVPTSPDFQNNLRRESFDDTVDVTDVDGSMEMCIRSIAESCCGWRSTANSIRPQPAPKQGDKQGDTHFLLYRSAL